MKLNRRWKSLIHKVEHLKIELEDHRDEVKEYEVDFTAALLDAERKLSPEPESTETSTDIVAVGPESPAESSHDTEEPDEEQRPAEEFPPEPEVERPESMRKLWKAVASATHPDRTGGDPELTEIYKKASKAWTAGSYEDLFEAALEARVKLPDPEPELVEMLEKRSTVITAEISKIEQSVLWMWGRAPKEKKDAILQLFLAQRAMRRQVVNKGG